MKSFLFKMLALATILGAQSYVSTASAADITPTSCTGYTYVGFASGTVTYDGDSFTLTETSPIGISFRQSAIVRSVTVNGEKIIIQLRGAKTGMIYTLIFSDNSSRAEIITREASMTLQCSNSVKILK